MSAVPVDGHADARLRALVENAVDLISLFDENGVVLYHSPALRSILGYEDGQRVGRSMMEIVHEDDREVASQFMRDTLMRPQELHEATIRLRDARGRWRFVEARARNRLDDPAVRAIVVNSRDITDIVNTEQELQRMERALRHAERIDFLGRMSGGLAHDFRNVLAAIRGAAELIRDEADGSVLSEEAAAILEAVDRGKDLVDRLMAFSREHLPAMQRVSVGALLERTRPLLRHLAGPTIRIELTIVKDATVMADPVQLQQVLLNLTANAREAMREGGHLHFTVDVASLEAREAASLAGRAASVNGRYCRIDVRDGGSGIEPAELPHIFEPFYTTKAETGGTGFGLSNVLAIVTEARGGIDVKSVPGGGTTFALYLPAIDVA